MRDPIDRFRFKRRVEGSPEEGVGEFREEAGGESSLCVRRMKVPNCLVDYR